MFRRLILTAAPVLEMRVVLGFAWVDTHTPRCYGLSYAQQ